MWEAVQDTTLIILIICSIKFNELCKVEKNKLPVDLDMIEIDEICMAYSNIIDVFPELKKYDYRHNQTI